MTEQKKTFSVPQWLNSILISLLLIVASAVFLQNRETQKSVETLQIQQAVLSSQLANHFQFAEEGITVVKENEKRLDDIEKTYMTRDEVLKQLDLIYAYVEKNYQRK